MLFGGTAHGRRCLVGALEEPAAISCLSDDHQRRMKESRRSLAAMQQSGKQPCTVPGNQRLSHMYSFPYWIPALPNRFLFNQ